MIQFEELRLALEELEQILSLAITQKRLQDY